MMNLVNQVVGLTALVLAVVCAYSRITDHRHHMVDVLTGSAVGAALGVITAQTLTFSCQSNQKSFMK